MSKKIRVVVADNGRYMDPEASYELPPFDDLESAVAKRKQIVEEYLESAYEPGMTAEALYASYKAFGDDPYIISSQDAGNDSFSAWDYAKERSAALTEADNDEFN